MKKYILFSFLTLFSIITAYGMQAGEPAVPAKFYIVRPRRLLDHDNWVIRPRFVIEALPSEKELGVLKPEPFFCRWPTVLRREFVECEGPSRCLTESEWKVIADSKCREDELVRRCISDGNIAEVKRLLERRTKPNGYESSHLKTAIIFHQPEIIVLLLEKGADANEEFDGSSPLRLAFDSMQDPLLTLDKAEDIVCSLLHEGADCGEKDKGDGHTPLHWVAGANMQKAASFLVREKEADVHAKIEGGFTPLHWTVLKRGKREMVQFLLEQGATVSAKSGDGRTASDMIMRKGCNLSSEYRCSPEEEVILELFKQYKGREISENRVLIEFGARSTESPFSKLPVEVVSQIKQWVCY